MLAAQRQKLIVDEIRREGGVRVSELTGLLAVSEMTIRRDIDVLVQVSLSGDSAGAGRGGIPRDGVAELADAVAAVRHLTLRGLMAVAPLRVDPAVAFAELAMVSQEVRSEHPTATWISAGMSADLEAAVANGATHLRVGSAILGSRPAFG